MLKKVIVGADETIICPKCSERFPLDKGIASQTMEKYETEYEEEFKKRTDEITEQIRQVEEKKAKRTFAAKEAELNEQLTASKEACGRAEATAKKTLENEREKLTAEFTLERENLKQELTQKETALKDLREKELTFRKEKQQFDEKKANFELDMQRLLDDERAKLREQIAKTEGEKTKKAVKEAQSKLAGEFELERETLRQDLNQKDASLKAHQENELKFRKEKQQFEQEKENLELNIQRRLDEERQTLHDKIAKIEAEKAKKAFDQKEVDLQERLAASERTAALAKKALDETRLKLSEDFDQERVALRQELELKESALKTFREQELSLRKEKQRLEEEKANLEIDVQRKIDEERQKIQEQTVKAESEKYRLREADVKKKLDDALKANEDLTRKLEQGSQQFQGEVLELELETLLRTSFPHDKIEPVKKGQRGADILHTVYTVTGQRCGTIIWEAKRAENWADRWIQKLKDDQLEAKAEIAVIVTTNMPPGIEDAFLLHENIWITKDFITRPVAQSLRILLLEANNLKLVNTGKNEKMEALYNYLYSPQFSQKIRSVLEIFSGMQKDLNQERNAFAKIWKKREAQIERVTTNMAGMVGELEAISQESFQELENIEPLSLPGFENQE